MPRRFPAPWSAELTPNCFIVRDADGQQLAYIYYESGAWATISDEINSAKKEGRLVGRPFSSDTNSNDGSGEDSRCSSDDDSSDDSRSSDKNPKHIPTNQVVRFSQCSDF